MHVTESPPAKIWGSRPTGLGGVVVSASLAPQQRMKATRPIFSQADPKLDVKSPNTKKEMGKNFTEKKIGFLKKKLKR
jgi:hypothetical protein